jgi:hypothetical protein
MNGIDRAIYDHMLLPAHLVCPRMPRNEEREECPTRRMNFLPNQIWLVD